MALVDHRVELRDAAGNLQHIFPKPASLQWAYLRRGGCEQAVMEVVADFATYDPDTLQGYDMRVLLDTGAGLAVWWRGFVVEAARSLAEPDTFRLQAEGYASRLDPIALVGTGFPIEGGQVIFRKMDATTIATQMIDRAKPWVALTYDGTSAPASGISLDEFSVNGTILDALRTLAEIAGMRDWGVDRNLRFWFLPKSTAIKHVAVQGKDVLQFTDSSVSRNMINRLYLIGANENTFVLEDQGGTFATDQSQTTQNSMISFGKTPGTELLQSFSPTRPILSKIELMLRAVGFGANLVSPDADMEASDTSNWTALNSNTKISKDTTVFASGTRSLKCKQYTLGPRYGFYRNITVSAGLKLTLACQVKVMGYSLTKVKVELVEGTGAWSNQNILASTEVDFISDWTNISLMATVAGTTAGLRWWCVDTPGPKPDIFWVDNVSLIQDGAPIEVSLVEQTAAGPPPTFDTEDPLAVAQIAFKDLSASFTVQPVSLIVSYLDTTKVYGIRIRSLGTANDTRYFETRSTMTDVYAGGKPYSSTDGDSWTEVTGTDLYFRTLISQAILDRGLRSRVVTNTQISNTSNAQRYGNAILADLSAPRRRGYIVLTNWEQMIELDVPLGLFWVPGLMPSGLQIERITYLLEDKGLSVQLELEQLLPKITDYLAYLEHQLALRQ